MENNQNGELTPPQSQNSNQPPTDFQQSQSQSLSSKKGIKPWIINTIVVALVFIIAMVLPGDKSKSFMELVVFTTFIFILFDGYRIDIDKYPATFFGRSAWGYAFLSIILWPIVLPYYISRRYKIINGEIQMKEKYIKTS